MEKLTRPQSERLLERFYTVWEHRVNRGEVHVFGGPERKMLEHFADWMCQNFDVTAKPQVTRKIALK